MSIEALMTRLCDAVETQNELLTRMLAGKAGLTSPDAPKPAATAAKPAAGAKPAAAKPAAKPAATKPVVKEMTVEEFTAKFGAYLKMGDAEDREAAKLAVRAIADYFQAEKVSSIDKSNFKEALAYLDQYIAGETPEFAGVEDEEEGSDESLL